jgi:hypothetical protein
MKKTFYFLFSLFSILVHKQLKNIIKREAANKIFAFEIFLSKPHFIPFLVCFSIIYCVDFLFNSHQSYIFSSKVLNNNKKIKGKGKEKVQRQQSFSNHSLTLLFWLAYAAGQHIKFT